MPWVVEQGLVLLAIFGAGSRCETYKSDVTCLAVGGGTPSLTVDEFGGDWSEEDADEDGRDCGG